MVVTVNILTYKQYGCLYEAISSVLSQDYSNIQLIVSDDGSPAFPKQEIINYIEEKKGRNLVEYIVLDNKENVGTVRHKNNIIPYIKGELLIPLAGDDQYLDCHVISRIVERYHQTNFNILATSRAKFIEDGQFLTLMPHYLSRSRINLKMSSAEQQHKLFTECKSMDFASGSAMACKTSFIKEMGCYDEKYRLWEDGPFINKITSRGYAITLGYDIISIKYRGGGVSSGGNPIIRNDVELFNRTDRWINAEKYGRFHKRILEYTQLKFSNPSMIKKIINRFLYMDVFIDVMFYRYGEYLRSYFDKKHLRTL